MAGLDLTGIRDFIESIILDTGLMVRDNGASDDVLDESTGELTPNAPTDVYEGSGAVQALPAKGSTVDIDTQTTPVSSETTSRLMLPLDSPKDIRMGDIWEVLTVNPDSGDVQMIGEKYEVTEVPSLSAYTVVRFVYLKPA